MEDADEGDGGCATRRCRVMRRRPRGSGVVAPLCFWAGVPPRCRVVRPSCRLWWLVLLLLKPRSLVNSGADFSGPRPCGGVA